MRGDPYQTEARFKSTCPGCGKAIKRGEVIYIWPLAARGKKAYCKCGEAEYRQAMAACMDEGAGFPVSSYM